MKDCTNVMSGISKIKILLLQFLSIAIVSVVAPEGSAQPQSAKERRAALSKKLRDTDFEILKLYTDEIDRNKKRDHPQHPLMCAGDRPPWTNAKSSAPG